MKPSNLPPGVTDNMIENFLCVFCARCGELIADDVKEVWEETCPDCLERQEMDAMNSEEW